jgi:RNA-directed DNA polymerase
MSFEARSVAVIRITVNDGKKTSGFDNIVWDSPIKKSQAITQLREILVGKSGSYQLGSVRRVWIPKFAPGELRPLGIPNMIDRVLQALILFCLDQIVEEMSDTLFFWFQSISFTFGCYSKDMNYFLQTTIAEVVMEC